VGPDSTGAARAVLRERARGRRLVVLVTCSRRLPNDSQRRRSESSRREQQAISSPSRLRVSQDLLAISLPSGLRVSQDLLAMMSPLLGPVLGIRDILAADPDPYF
jgi:hypothetical protein